MLLVFVLMLRDQFTFKIFQKACGETEYNSQEHSNMETQAPSCYITIAPEIMINNKLQLIDSCLYLFVSLYIFF